METLQTDFISNVSYEMKTPLAVMQNYGTLLQAPDLPEDRRIEYAKGITDSSRRLADMVTNILKLNKLENQQIFPHADKPIIFIYLYLRYELGSLDKQVERRKGDWYVVSPFKLIMNEGNCYLMAVNEKGKLINYHRDRMRNIQLTGEPREGEDVFATVKLSTYSRRVFNMYRGEEQRVLIRFIPPLLDTMVERFGTGDGVLYYRYDDRHLAVRTYVEVSDQFFGWLLGFGKRMKLMEADGTAVEEFRAYLDKVRAMYE